MVTARIIIIIYILIYKAQITTKKTGNGQNQELAYTTVSEIVF